MGLVIKMFLYAKELILATFAVYIRADDNLVSWKNDQIEAIRSANPVVGEPLIIAVRHKEEFTRSTCEFRRPLEDGSVSISYKVIDGVVYDGNDQVVDGVEPWNDSGDLSVCGLKVLSMEDMHDESPDLTKDGWIITMHFEEGGILGQENLNKIQVEIHLKEDFLRPLLDVRFGHLPEHYDLSLIPDLTSTDDVIHFQGKVKITLRTTSYPGFIIPVQMNGLDIRSLNGTATRQDSEPELLDYHMIYFNLQEDLVILFVMNPLFEIGDIIEPEIEFEASVDHPGWGLYKELCNSQTEKYCWFTQFEANGARYAFPCHDEPSAKATFDVRVARTEGWKTLGNMPIVRSEPVEEMPGWTWDVFETTPKMSAYLLAFAIQDYGFVTGTDNVTVWATQEFIDAGYADYASLVGPDVIHFMEELYGVKYSLPKMDMVNVPNFGGAMENWGLILYEFDYLLYDQEHPDEEKRWNVIETVAHELSHQWFGNLVTMKWWDQLWLNEGFATYVSHVVVEGLDSSLNSWDRFVADRMMFVMMGDSTAASWAVSNPVVSNDDINRKFGSFSYYKGGALIRMMESFLGVDTLVKGLSSYLNNMAFMNAVEEDLFTHLEAAGLIDGKWPQQGVEDFTETMKTWTQQAGLPLVTVRKVSENGKTVIEAAQTWYKDGVVGSTDQLWDIPLTWVDLADENIDWDNTTPDAWLTDTDIEIDAAEDTIPLLNKKAVGYYRVNYSPDIWASIADILNTNHKAIHPLNRAQIICDVISLEAQGYLEADTMDNVLQYFENEDAVAPMRAYNRCHRGFKTDGFKRI